MHSIIMGLVKDSFRTRSTSIGMKYEGPSEVSIGQDRYCCAQVFWFIKYPLTPVMPKNGCLLLTHIFARGQLMQWPGYLSKLGDKPAITPSESKDVSDLSNGSMSGPLLNDFCHLSISCYHLCRDNVPQIGNLFVEQLIL